MNALDEIEAAVQRSAARQRQLAQVQADVAERRFIQELPDVVRVTVNGTGDVLDIELAAGCLDTGRQPHLLGERITRTVANARRQAALGVRDALAAVLGEHAASELVGDEEEKPVRRSRSRDLNTDDYFEDKDAKGFLEEQPWLP